MSRASVEALDPNFARSRVEGDFRWIDVSEWRIEGKGWPESESPYDRLPARAKGAVRDPVWDLSQCSAGLCVRFVADSPVIAARWRLRRPSLAMDHMPATGVSGLDLYARRENGWRWVGVGRPTRFPDNEAFLAQGVSPLRREYMLYLPLYNGADRVAVGVAKNSFAGAAPARAAANRKPVCFYGTSITQGGCCSRPGMTYAAILGRRLDRPAINLGFSGNGQAEPEVARLLAELNPSAYVVDCLPNLQEPQITERIESFVRILRSARRRIAIVLVDNIRYQGARIIPSRYERYTTSNAAQRAVFRRLVAAGDQNLHYVTCGRLLGNDDEATVDGTHFTDLGYFRFARALEPVLRRILGETARRGARP